MNDHLIASLRAAEKETLTLEGPDGSQLLVLPHGGRILGLYASGDSRNFLWTNPALNEPESARAFFTSKAWTNSGGERTWLSPEIDFFLPNFPDLDAYHQPRALDPGKYQAHQDADGIHLQMDLSLTPLRDGFPVKLRLGKSAQLASNPLHQTRDMSGMEDIQFAGFTMRTWLEILDPLGSIPPIGLWSLLQLPHGGEMLLSTYGTTEPTVYFGTIPPADLRVEPNGVRYRTREKGGQKIGLPATACTGRTGYHYEADGMSHLIVRSFNVNPSGQYVDPPWTRPDDLGYAVQVCNIDVPEFGKFSELEYHVPAIGGTTGQSRSDDTSNVWAFRGSRVQINLIAENMLGLSL